MPFAAERHCSRAAIFECSQCGYATFDAGNRKKHKAKHQTIETRHVVFGVPATPASDRFITLDHVKEYMYANNTCTCTPEGLDVLLETIGPGYIAEFNTHRFSVTETMRRLLLMTWGQRGTKPAGTSFANVFRWNHRIYWYRSVFGASRSIDDFTFLEFPDSRKTIEKLTFELFKLVGDINVRQTLTQNEKLRDVEAETRWLTMSLTGLDEMLVPGDIEEYQSWMGDVADLLDARIPSHTDIVGPLKRALSRTTRKPTIFELDTDAPPSRRVKVYACKHCPYASPIKTKYTRHVQKCKRRIRLDKDDLTPYEYRVAWYTMEEQDRLDPFSPRDVFATDILRDRPNDPGRRSSFMMQKRLPPDDAARLTLPQTCLEKPTQIDDAIIACFDLLFGKRAAVPDFRAVVLDGRFAIMEILIRGETMVRRVHRDTVLLRVLPLIKAYIGIANMHQFALNMKAFEYTRFSTRTPSRYEKHSFDDIIDLVIRADEGIVRESLTSTADEAYAKILDIGGVRDVCRRAVDCIPTDHEFVNYLGPLEPVRRTQPA